MASAYTVLPERSLVITRGWGILTDRDALVHARALEADPRFAPGFCQLTDLRDVVRMDMTRPGIRQLAQANPFGPGARRAVVAHEGVVYGMARMYQQMRGETPDAVELFRELDQAIEWLGLGAAKSELAEVLRQTRTSLVPE